MAPRRGRGRGKMRARPPQVIRNSIAELGNYDADVKAALQQNLDAARAYFPPLSKNVRAVVTPPLVSEQKLLHFHTTIRKRMLASPTAIQLPAVSRPSALRSQLHQVSRFYRTRSADVEQPDERQSLWDMDACWIVPDLLPVELLPKAMRQSSRPRKRAKIVAQPSEADLTPQQLLQNLQQQEAEGQGNEADAKQAADDDEQDFEPAAPEQDDDEDVDHIADYQTGVHFDDDDGYEEVESGDDAEPVVAF